MKNLEVLPTEENLISTLEEDLLNRNKDIVCFYDLLLAQEFASAIAIEGSWGSGKTFFIKHTMMLINANNPLSKMEEDIRCSIKDSIINSSKLNENYEMAIYYDAWQNDNDIDPLLSIIYEITEQIGVTFDYNKSNIFKLGSSIIETISGKNVEGIIEGLRSENPLAKLEEDKDLDDIIREFFGEILKEKAERLVIFVDELDRCKPSYAVQLLERVKHYLSNERITFVFSVNMEQLQHTIKHYYGNTFDSSRYLDRFFDMRISLPPADRKRFYQKIGLDSNYILETVCCKFIEVYNMELREISRFYRQVRTAVYEPTHESSTWEFSFSEGKGKQFLMTYILPITIGLKIVDITLYREFISGKNSEPLMLMYRESDLGKKMASRLLDRNESFEDYSNTTMITVEEKLKALYTAIFVKEYSNGIYRTLLGDYEFNAKSKEFLKTLESMMTEYADYNV